MHSFPGLKLAICAWTFHGPFDTSPTVEQATSPFFHERKPSSWPCVSFHPPSFAPVGVLAECAWVYLYHKISHTRKEGDAGHRALTSLGLLPDRCKRAVLLELLHPSRDRRSHLRSSCIYRVGTFSLPMGSRMRCPCRSRFARHWHSKAANGQPQ